MFGKFKCDQHVFVHLFRKKILFDINGSTEFLSTQMRTLKPICFNPAYGNVMQEGKF